MDPDQEKLLKETYRLSLENNKLLRKMRRQAFWAHIITWLIYAALLIAPIWFYMTYLSGTVDHLLKMYGVMQNDGQEAQSQFQSFKEALQQFQARMQSQNASSSDSGTQ